MPHVDFDRVQAERLRAEHVDPITFTVAGSTFTCLAIIPLSVAYQLADADELPSTQLSIDPHVRYVRSLLIPECRPKFDEAIRSDTVAIDARTMYDLASWLTAEITGRPTVPSTEPSSGRQTTTNTSSDTTFNIEPDEASTNSTVDEV